MPTSNFQGKIPILDGGGLATDADWLSPRAGVDFFAGLERRFLHLAAELSLVGRLSSHAHVARRILFSQLLKYLRFALSLSTL